jgi:predicted MPP superfamily phosphohydrolase
VVEQREGGMWGGDELEDNRRRCKLDAYQTRGLMAAPRIFGQCDVYLRRSPLSLQQFDWVKEVAGYFDIVVLAGDLLDVGSIVDLRDQSVVVKKYLSKVKEKIQLLICSGNHDLDTRDQTGEKVSRRILDARSYGVFL